MGSHSVTNTTASRISNYLPFLSALKKTTMAAFNIKGTGFKYTIPSWQADCAVIAEFLERHQFTSVVEKRGWEFLHLWNVCQEDINSIYRNLEQFRKRHGGESDLLQCFLSTPDPLSSESLQPHFQAQSFDIKRGQNAITYHTGYFCMVPDCPHSIYQQQQKAYVRFSNLKTYVQID